jgi:hypothetical protein
MCRFKIALWLTAKINHVEPSFIHKSGSNSSFVGGVKVLWRAIGQVSLDIQFFRGSDDSKLTPAFKRSQSFIRAANLTG